jgi:hypothetical protein
MYVLPVCSSRDRIRFILELIRAETE